VAVLRETQGGILRIVQEAVICITENGGISCKTGWKFYVYHCGSFTYSIGWQF
jgi:hypothetical protein